MEKPEIRNPCVIALKENLDEMKNNLRAKLKNGDFLWTETTNFLCKRIIEYESELRVCTPCINTDCVMCRIRNPSFITFPILFKTDENEPAYLSDI